MNYALLNSNNEILEISEEPISVNNQNFSIVQIPDFLEGDEVNYYIVVNEINEDGVCTSYSAVKQTPFIQTILANNKELTSKVSGQEQAIFELAEIIAMGGMNNG